MTRLTTRVVLGYYSDADTALVHFREIGKQRLGRMVVLRRESGETSLYRKSGLIPAVRRGGVAALIFLAAFGIFSFFPFTATTAAAFTIIASFLIWGGFRIGAARSIPADVIARFGPTLLPGETLLVVWVRASKVPDVLALFRQSDSPSTFILRPDPSTAAELEEVCAQEPLSPDQLRSHAVELAQQISPLPPAKRHHPLLETLSRCEVDLEGVSRDLVESTQLEKPLSNASEWLYDNFHLIRSNVAEIRQNLPKHHDKILPALKREDGQIEFRIYAIAASLAHSTDSAVTSSNLTDFLASYQTAQPLTIAELWAFPLILKLVLIEQLCRLGQRVSWAERQRDLAYFWADRLIHANRQGQEHLDRLLDELEHEPAIAQSPFVVRLTEQLHDDEITLTSVREWLERHAGPSLADAVRQEHAGQARDRVSIANAVGSLRRLAQIDFKEAFEQVSHVDGILRKDPANVYGRCDFATRNQCRTAVEQIARHGTLHEVEVAEIAVQIAAAACAIPHTEQCHVGYYLLDDGLEVLEKRASYRTPLPQIVLRILQRHATFSYISSIVLFSTVFVLFASALSYQSGVRSPFLLILFSVLAYFPASELVVHIVNELIVTIFPPRTLPKMSFERGIPEDCSTLVVVPMMLLTPESIRTEAEKLEIRYLANKDSSLHFSLLSDFTDAPEAHMPEDDGLLGIALEAIGELNERYPGERFLLFHRPRRWSDSENRWIGWERKRGKIEELTRFLCGETLPYERFLIAGRLPEQVEFVITLDADTQLPAGAARRMIETIAHPLNRVRLAEDGRTRSRGYTIIQPRVSITLPGTTATRFTRLFTDASGTDPYCQAVSDAYQDLFGEAIYHGKAIFDVRAFHQILSGRFPPESLLSHDLIEGVYVGVALASDIELFENFPYDYQSHSRRLHRWIRGDWQIAPWIFWKVQTADGWENNPLSAISRWKILDNLRRSLVPAASVALLVIGWLIGAAPEVWSGFTGLCFAFPVLAQMLNSAAMWIQGRRTRIIGQRRTELVRLITTLAFLPHQAWISLDAIARVLYRRSVSRQHLLEWETAELTHVHAARHLNLVFFQIVVICLLTAVLMMVLFPRGLVGPPFPFLALWLAAPEVLRWIGNPNRQPAGVHLHETDRLLLRKVARETWRYFDDLVGPRTNWLPPDNSQEALRVEVAQRTSPTNIGMWLTSALAARDLGYLTPDQFVERCLETLTTLEKLERYEGHLLNWYNIQTLEPLNPRYVSTVDSGNLIACFWLLEAGCRELLSSPLLSPVCLRGLSDTLNVAHETIDRRSHSGIPFSALGNLFRAGGASSGIAERIRLAREPAHQLVESLRWGSGDNTERAYWLTRLEQHVTDWRRIVDRYLRWLELLAAPPQDFLSPLGKAAVEARRQSLHHSPSLSDIANGPSEPLRTLLSFRSSPGTIGRSQLSWLEELASEYGRSQTLASEAISRLENLAARMAKLADGVNMKFLYDQSRRLFRIGYSIGGPLDDSTHYDLLASEARLSSLIAIAKGDVPIDHWMALGRPYVSEAGGQLLLSWSGTMFEYLMPLLFNYAYENSMLNHSCRLAVERQIEYARERGIPWGISESAFAALDAHQTYQYMAFGVPGLGMKRGLEDDLVVSPYSTVLALMVDRPSAIENLKRLDQAGLRGRMGFYEALDYTRQRSREGGGGVVIYAYMAHHQGMSLMAIDNVLHRDIMRKRFHSDPRIRAAESLLFEGIPKLRSLLPRAQPDESVAFRLTVEATVPPDRIFGHNTPVPRAHLLGNGRYSLFLTNSGGGYSKWQDIEITRWRADTTRDHWGAFCYIRDVRSGKVWSAAYHPADSAEEDYSAIFSADRIEFFRRDSGIDCHTEVTVSPEDDAEIRRITLTNRSLRSRLLELTSFCELSLAPHAADRSHPVFSKLFVQTEVLPELKALLATRRARSPREAPVWIGQLVFGGEESTSFQYETDRAIFLGRGNGWDQPAGLSEPLSGSCGTVLDPIFALRRRIEIEPRERIQVTFVMVAGETRDAVVKLLERFRIAEACHRTFELAWTHAQLNFRYLGIQTETAHRFQELASHMVFPNLRMRAPIDRIRRNRLHRSRLWAHGISGDLPLMVVTVADHRGIPLAREALLAHTFWRMRGFKADLVFLNQESQGYEQPLREQLLKLIQAHSLYTGSDRPGGVFLLNWHQLPDDELTLLLTAARVSLGPGRSLVEHLSRSDVSLIPRRLLPPERPVRRPPHPLPFLELPYFNGLGGFSGDGREYSIYLAPGLQTPMPWVNVMSNPSFGALVSESGPGFCWYGNSQTNRLTPWGNDPIINPSGEAVYVRDDDTGEVWTPTALPIREEEAYRANHGAGYTRFEYNGHGIEQILLAFVPVDSRGGDPVRIQILQLKNISGESRRLSVIPFCEWVLGTDREETQQFLLMEWDASCHALLARNPHHAEYGGHIAFAAVSPEPISYTADRSFFLGRNGSRRRPMGLEHQRLSGRTGAGLDPCAAFQVQVTLEPGARQEVIFILGQAETVEEARRLIRSYRDPKQVNNSYGGTCEHWDALLSAIQVRTPILSVNFLLNRWLLYQSLSCRFWGRSAMYQSGGGFGFRDQLQDILAFVWTAPEITRKHILRAASRQFVEGDVQHWWHPPSGVGVRTRCSDDLLWLPFAVCHYVRVTGDHQILDENVPFLEGPLLKDGEGDAYFVPATSPVEESLFEHCRHAIERASKRGSHGLPLIGSGDWNDGMNLVGEQGKGESIWLAWFLIDVLNQFADLCEERGAVIAENYRRMSEEIRAAVESSGWDGDWYRRAYHDDGTSLGSRESPEAKIDSIAQSWAVISGAAEPMRAKRAMEAVEQLLVKDAERLVLLFDPPFDHSQPHPGYIQGYPPGVRENGGQYTHAALWVAQAFARLSYGDRAVSVLQLLNPVELTHSPGDVARYQGEPYVVAADVYRLDGRVGRCGWTWYTGSSGWMYRIWIEEILGLQLRGDSLQIRPALPRTWPECSMTYRYRSATYEIVIKNVTSSRPRTYSVTLDGQLVSGDLVPLSNDGRIHNVTVQLGEREELEGLAGNRVSLGADNEPARGRTHPVERVAGD